MYLNLKLNKHCFNYFPNILPFSTFFTKGLNYLYVLSSDVRRTEGAQSIMYAFPPNCPASALFPHFVTSSLDKKRPVSFVVNTFYLHIRVIVKTISFPLCCSTIHCIMLTNERVLKWHKCLSVMMHHQNI